SRDALGRTAKSNRSANPRSHAGSFPLRFRDAAVAGRKWGAAATRGTRHSGPLDRVSSGTSERSRTVNRNWRSPACWLLLAALFTTVSFSGQANGQRKAAALPAAPDTPPAHDKTEDLDLAMGENRTISAIDVKNYSEGNPGYIDVKLTTDGTQFV